jgi:hypothetical protein
LFGASKEERTGEGRRREKGRKLKKKKGEAWKM